MDPPATGNIVSTIGIRAVDNRGSCVDVEISLKTECVPFIHVSEEEVINASRYSSHGVSVRKHRQGVGVAVPNCENIPLVLWVVCDEVRNQSMIRLVISRGVNLRPTSHGILGNFPFLYILFHSSRSYSIPLRPIPFL